MRQRCENTTSLFKSEASRQSLGLSALEVFLDQGCSEQQVHKDYGEKESPAIQPYLRQPSRETQVWSGDVCRHLKLEVAAET